MYNQAIALRDAIVRALKNDEKINGITVTINDGYLIAATDVAMLDISGNCQAFRIAVIPHKLDYRVFT